MFSGFTKKEKAGSREVVASILVGTKTKALKDVAAIVFSKGARWEMKSLEYGRGQST